MPALTAARPSTQASLLDPSAETATGGGERAAPMVARSAGGHDGHPRPTLDDLVTRAWEALTTAHGAACLVCGEAVVPRYGAGPRPVAATCRSCGSEVA